MILGILAALAGIVGMLAYGLFLGPAAVVVGLFGLILALRKKGAPIAMNIIGIFFGVAAFLLSPVPGTLTPPQEIPAEVASAPETPAPVETPIVAEQPTPETPAEIADRPIAPGEIVVNAIPETAPENAIYAGDFGDDIVDISLTLDDKVNAATGLQSVYVAIINKSEDSLSDVSIAIGLKEQGLWPQPVLAALTLFDTTTLSPGAQLKFTSVPFKTLYQITIGNLPARSSRKITLNLNAYDAAIFASNIYAMRKDRTGSNQPLAWLINGKIEP